jgi:hypothetical protein
MGPGAHSVGEGTPTLDYHSKLNLLETMNSIIFLPLLIHHFQQTHEYFCTIDPMNIIFFSGKP